ncbi:MAG TPA: T9SS type A sorting domain-containing protein, partial [Flavobacteriales bacterium]|nr:T9SS type A sorting domain-containing protein [Flavobacteriales bacterium]
GTAVLDDCGVCGGDNSSCTGCMDELATNFDSDATIPDNDSCCYLVITSASITYNDWGIGLGTVVTEGGVGEVTIVWTDADDVVATNTDSLAYSAYTVTVTDSNDCTVLVDATQTALNDIDPLAFGLFPNPTTGAITLQVSTEMHDVNLQVFDATGRVVFTQSNLIVQGSISLDFSNLSTGTYTIMLNNNNGVSVRRLSIQH